MPKVIKKKPVKKKPIREDEVKSAALQVLEKLKERQRYAIIAASAIAGLVLLYVILSLYSASSNRRAYALEQEAYQMYYGAEEQESLSDEERWKKALDLYRKSADIKETPTALFYLGTCYYNLGDYENAAKQYSRFIDKFSGERLILPLVYQKLASSYFKVGQNDKALDTLNRLAGVNKGIFKDTALMQEARYYESLEQKEKAMEKYKELIAAFPASPWSAEANSKVSAEEVENAEESTEKTPEAEIENAEVPLPGSDGGEIPVEQTGGPGAQ